MKKEHRILLLQLARRTLQAHFENKKYDLEKIPPEFQEKRGVFVTLHKKGELRGCIGYILPVETIYNAVRQNALSAAFHDPRFPPLEKEELSEIKIEISILSVPEKLEFSSPEDLLQKLTKKEGVILEKNGRQATFLPQVWESFPDKEDFLEHLSQKADLDLHEWKRAKISVYFAEVFSE